MHGRQQCPAAFLSATVRSTATLRPSGFTQASASCSWPLVWSQPGSQGSGASCGKLTTRQRPEGVGPAAARGCKAAPRRRGSSPRASGGVCRTQTRRTARMLRAPACLTASGAAAAGSAVKTRGREALRAPSRAAAMRVAACEWRYQQGCDGGGELARGLPAWTSVPPGAGPTRSLSWSLTRRRSGRRWLRVRGLRGSQGRSRPRRWPGALLSHPGRLLCS